MVHLSIDRFEIKRKEKSVGFRGLKTLLDMFDGEENEQDGGESEEGEQMMDDGPAYTLELAEAAYRRIADRLALDSKGEMPSSLL